MTIAQTHCPVCRSLFQPSRKAQRTCSARCKQTLFRAEKCNAGHDGTPEVFNRLEMAATPVSDGNFTLLYPGLKPLSELECRLMKIRPTGERDHLGALLYRPLKENEPVTAATVPALVHTQILRGN